MNQHKVVTGALLACLGIGLHLTFKGLAGELPHLFPHTTNETPPEIVPMTEPAPNFSELTDVETAPPKAARHLSRIPPQHLVRSTPIPALQRMDPELNRAFDASSAVTPDLAPMVDFWRKIYTTYTTDQVVFHDPDHLEIQYGVLDFTELNQRPISDVEKSAIREEAIRREMERLREMGRDNIRTQFGLRNRFMEGLQDSGKYLPLFEEIFQSYGIPVEVSRLAFIESLFKERAFSKVGAAGLWQFMPGTARRFMTVDRLVDERYDPIIATHAAARLLLRNYQLLGTWPLAINAYNSGPGNLLKAISRLGTRDISTIIKNFKSGSYAFASRNFYPQFLAALEAYDNQQKYFGEMAKQQRLDFDLLELPTTMSFPEIAYLADISINGLKELNPAFAPVVFGGDYSLPASSQVRIPPGSHQIFSTRFVEYFNGSEAPLFHVVAPHESLREIASLYGLSPAELQRANASNAKFEAGRVLRVPPMTHVVRNKTSF